MIHDDEQQLWDAMIKKSKDGKDVLISAMQLGEAMGMSTKRIIYLSKKWCRQGKWMLFGTMSGVVNE